VLEATTHSEVCHCCEFIAALVTILPLIPLLFRRCYPAVLPLFRAAVPADKTKQLQ
jgi:hypothetical protein